jgi:hypothetical protein
MAAIDTKSDVEILEALDFQRKEPCEVQGCSMAATFVLKCRTCAGASTCCTTHYLELRHRFNELGCRCLRCHRTANTLNELCHIIPIGGR